MQRLLRHRPRFALWALVATVAALGSSFLVMTDSHGRQPSPVGGRVVASADHAGPIEATPCAACFLRAQLEGGEFAVTGGLGAANAVPERLPNLDSPAFALLIGPALPARGPPGSPVLPV